MRGIFDAVSMRFNKFRFNPAYAGNMVLHLCIMLLSQVQPRVCGEYPCIIFEKSPQIGSTPRMRGIFNCYPVDHDGFRFNPAYAGNIGADIRRADSIQVQPRVCGEYKLNTVNSKLDAGSTPRMRGILITCAPSESTIRFNPAYAGNMRKIQEYRQTI